MSLWFIGQKAPCFNYDLWGGSAPPTYNDWLVTPPRIYQENINRLEAFFYVPGNDLLVAFLWLNYAYWPSWLHIRLEWDASTGNLLSRAWTPIWSLYSRGACIGSYGRIYSTYINAYDVYDVDWQTLDPQTMVWTCPNPIQYYALINLEDDKAMTISSWVANLYKISTGEKTGVLRFPVASNYITWESRRHAWSINPNGAVFKIAYAASPPRFEMMSSVQKPDPTALDYRIAFDTLRNRLAVLRWLPDSADGACNLNLEFYRPLVKVSSTGLTDPVPVTPVREGQSARFIAHLHGDTGEGLGAYYVGAALAAPATGDIISPSAPTLVNGEASFGYQAPPGSAGEQDTLVITASLEQDGS
jgi:hypothetical protein